MRYVNLSLASVVVLTSSYTATDFVTETETLYRMGQIKRDHLSSLLVTIGPPCRHRMNECSTHVIICN